MGSPAARHRNARRLTVAIVGLIATSVLTAPSAEATAACGSSGGWFDGAWQQGTALYAASAVISKPNVPGLCGSTNSDTSIWAMLFSGSNTLGYAQSGYGRTYGQSNAYYFAEYHHPNGGADAFKMGGIAASGVQYNERYDFTSGVIHMYVGSTNYLNTDYDPTLYWPTAWQAQWFAETHQNGDDVPGSSANPAYVSSMQILKCRSCGYSTASATASNNTSRYSEAWDTTGSKFHVWTK